MSDPFVRPSLWRPDHVVFKTGGEGELYRASTEMMVAPVTSSAELEIGTTRRLFEGDYLSGMCCGHSYDATLDGRRFGIVKGKPASELRCMLSTLWNALDRPSLTFEVVARGLASDWPANQIRTMTVRLLG